jgi:ABC-type amino acid transport substrate-binding protein
MLPLPLLAALLVGAALAPGSQSGGDLAQVRAHGRLVAEVFPIQDSRFVSLDLDVVRRQGLMLGQAHRPEHYKGLEIELLKGFADQLGVPLEIAAATGGIADILQAVVDRQADVAASGLMVTPARQQLVEFSAPYHSSWLAVVVRRDSRIAGPADLAGKRAAAIDGSSHLEFLRAAAPNARIELTTFDLEGLIMVDEGRADFTVIGTNDPPGGPAEAKLPSLKIAFRLRRLDTGIALRKGSDLTAPLDAYLASLRQSGELVRILARHGVKESEMAGTAHP